MKTPALMQYKNHPITMRYFSTNTHINKCVRSHRMHNTFSAKKRTRKLKLVNWNHEAVSYTDRFFVFYHGF